MFSDNLRVKVLCFLGEKLPSGLESYIFDRSSGPESYILIWLSGTSLVLLLTGYEF